MKIGIYTPYLDSFGGGERYMLTIAEALSEDSSVDLLFDRHHVSLQPANLIADLSEHLDIDLSRVNLIEAPLGKGSSPFRRFFFFRKYDALIYLTDGSVFYSTAKRSIIHFQVPFKNIAALGLWGKLKLSSWNLAIYNSKFTQSHAEKEWPIPGQVVYPPVEIRKIKPLQKKKQILSVGRFISFTKSKKHEDMIHVFADLKKSGQLEGWSLHLAGSVEGDASYVEDLKSLATGLPIVFYPDCPFDELMKLYGESSIYWHAAGFGETEPSKMEHFGITTVEAMAGKCVPVVINLGGQKEIVENGVNGFLWDNIEEFKKQTIKLVKDEKILAKMAGEAKKRVAVFSKEEFVKNIKKIIYGL